MSTIFAFALFAAVCYVVWTLARGGTLIARAAGASSKCASCRHAGKVFEDGTLCKFAGRETFKNEVHVNNCTDHQPR